MTTVKKLNIALCAVSISLATSLVFAQNQGHKMKSQTAAPNKNTLVMITPSDITWMDGPDSFPTGSQFAVLDGDPKAGGPYTIRVKIPTNYQFPPHFLSTPVKVTVISGTLNVGSGDKMDTGGASGGTALAAGSFMSVPANLHHYVWSNEDTVFQLSGQGPINLKYVNAADDPRNAKMVKPTNQMAPAAMPPMTSPMTTPTPSSPAPMNGTTNGTTTPSTAPSSNY